MGMPSIAITFTELASSLIQRGDRGVIAMIIKDNVPDINPFVATSNMDIPTNLTETNKVQIANALIGYINAPKKVIVYVLSNEAEDYTEALDYFKSIKFDYLVAPSCATDNQTSAIVSYVKNERTANKKIKAVLPNVKGDNEGVINFTTGKVFVGEKEFETEEYCSRIAGLIAGTPLSISCTYAVLPEVTDCTRLTAEARNKAVDAGEFILWFDGEKVKTGRAVNSLTTTTATKGESYQKIKTVDTMDMIENDIRQTAEDTFIGKYANTYDNKCKLVSAIGNYFDQLKSDTVISEYAVGIDMEANKQFLKGKGIDVNSLSDDEIKWANTGSAVYLTAEVKLVDAIEDITLKITL